MARVRGGGAARDRRVDPLSRRTNIRLPLAGRFFPSLRDQFVDVEALSGVVLLTSALVALVWANADPTSYADVWERVLTLGIGDASITLNLQHWVNDGLMTVFFFVVGLEIKREVIDGELSDRKTAALPALAALGGMVLPALLYFALNAGGAGARGWGIPMATDVAFAIGLLALLGSRVPSGLKLFVLTLAIVDDIGAIIVIALFYSSGVSGAWLAGSAAAVAGIVVMKRIGIGSPWLYVLPAIVLWICLEESGVHATIAGVALGLLTPGAPGPAIGPLERLERGLHPWSSFVVVPLFALANAGVLLTSDAIDAAVSGTIAGGIVLGLVVGKVVGITAFTTLGLRLRVGRLPSGMRARDVVGVGAVAGIGFTVSLFIADLSFEGTRLDEAKVGILAASLLAGTIGAILVRVLTPGGTPPPSGSAERVVAFSDDLMDRSKLTTSVPGIELVRDASDAAGATCVVVDLGRYGEIVGSIRAAVPTARIVAYGQHGDRDALDAAVAAGADVALARSRFFRDPAAAVHQPSRW